MPNDIPNNTTATVQKTAPTQYNGIDLVKFICALLVCAIHIDPFREGSSAFGDILNFGLQQYICRLAVPFFFVATGFFLFRKMDFSNIKMDVVKPFCFRLLRLLGLWNLILIVGGKGHLWYLGATVIAVLLICFLLKQKIKWTYLAAIAGLLYIIGLLGDSYYKLADCMRQISVVDYGIKLYGFLFQRTRNGVFVGVIFVLIGALFAQKKIRIDCKVAIAGFVISMLLLLGEVLVLKHFDFSKDYNMYVFLIPVTLFLFAIAAGAKLKDRAIYKTMRSAGVVIYFSHLLVSKMIGFFLTLVNKVTGINLVPYLFFVALPCIVCFAFLIVRLAQREKLKCLQWLYA